MSVLAIVLFKLGNFALPDIVRTELYVQPAINKDQSTGDRTVSTINDIDRHCFED